jgi:DNA polymerase III epsilon subunit-like protein
MTALKTVFADVETTGLDPARHQAWDIALIVRTADAREEEYQWFIQPDLAAADPFALRIGRFYERTITLTEPGGDGWAEPYGAALDIARLLDSALIVAANPAFDAAFLAAFLRSHDQVAAHDYHLRDIGSLVTGYIAGVTRGYEMAAGGRPDDADWPPLRAGSVHLADMARAVGVKPEAYEAHTAIGDARMARDIWDAVMA